MDEIIYQKINAMGCIWFTFPQKERYSISLFGIGHNNAGTTFPFNGDILSFQINTDKYLKIGRFFITDNKQFIVLGFDELGFLYGVKNQNDDYMLIDEPPEELVSDQMKILETEFLKKKLNKLSELYYHVF